MSRDMTATHENLTGLASAEDFVEAVRGALRREEFGAAQSVAARGAEVHADHPWLSQADRVLNPTGVQVKPADGQGRKEEFDWLRRHGHEYRGQWVALLGDELIVSSESAAEVIREVRSRRFDNRPLIHRVD